MQLQIDDSCEVLEVVVIPDRRLLEESYPSLTPGSSDDDGVPTDLNAHYAQVYPEVALRTASAGIESENLAIRFEVAGDLDAVPMEELIGTDALDGLQFRLSATGPESADADGSRQSLKVGAWLARDGWHIVLEDGPGNAADAPEIDGDVSVAGNHVELRIPLHQLPAIDITDAIYSAQRRVGDHGEFTVESLCPGP